jgi:hypothetical protein
MYLNLTKFVGSKYDVNHESEMVCSESDVHHITEIHMTYNEPIDVITILKEEFQYGKLRKNHSRAGVSAALKA